MRLVHRRSFPVDHFVLLDPEGRTRPDELIAAARRQAEALALRCTGDAGNFTLFQSGAGLARRAWPHVHIVCTRTRFRKGLIHLYIGLRNLLAGLFG